MPRWTKTLGGAPIPGADGEEEMADQRAPTVQESIDDAARIEAQLKNEGVSILTPVSDMPPPSKQALAEISSRRSATPSLVAPEGAMSDAHSWSVCS